MTAPATARLTSWHAFTPEGLAHAFVPGAPRSLCGDIRRQPLIFAHPVADRRRCEPCRDANAVYVSFGPADIQAVIDEMTAGAPCGICHRERCRQGAES